MTSAAFRGYGSEWRAARKVALAKQKTCQVCGTTERLEVDHITPKSEGGTNAQDNLRVLCHDHHRAKTISDLKRSGAPAPWDRGGGGGARRKP